MNWRTMNIKNQNVVSRVIGRDAQRGFTLIELMISLVLGLILVGGVMSVFSSNREAFRSTENLARMQENARVAFDLMARDIREAGTNACGSKLVANVTRSSTAIPWWSDWNLGPLRGYDAGQDVTSIVAIGTSANSRLTGTDAVLVMHASSDEKIITAHNKTTYEITLNSVDGLNQGDVVIACDPSSAAIFQIDTKNATTKVISHAADTTNINCNSNLDYLTTDSTPRQTDSTCASTDTNFAGKQFAAGGVLAKLVTNFWFIGVNSTGKSSLMRKKLTTTGSTMKTATATTEEVLEGVKDMQIEYLTKNASSGALATSWIPANDPTDTANPNPILADASGGWQGDHNIFNTTHPTANLNQPVAARITLTLESDEKIGDGRTNVNRTLIHVVGIRSRDLLFQASK